MAFIPQALEHRARPKSPKIARLITAFVFLVLYVPLVALIIYSFLDPLTGTWTLKFYPEAFADESLKSAIWTSLIVGVFSTIGSTILGTTAALALERYDFPGKRILDALTLVPLIVPEIVFGLSLLIWFVALSLTLGIFSIILAHITFSFSYVIITVRTRLNDFDQSLEEAAKDLGASPRQTFWKVTFPLIWPGILSGALMAFTLSFDDFLITFFTAGVGSDTLPIKLYSLIKYGVNPTINALSTMILVATIVMVLLMFKPQKTAKKKAAKSEEALTGTEEAVLAAH